jgi:hypothetical protein
VEAICELTAYKLMQQKKDVAAQKRILENPYTNGKIKDLIAAEREGGTDFVLNWVRNGTEETLGEGANLAPAPVATAAAPFVAGPRLLPAGLKFSGIMAFGKERLAVINGQEFAAGDEKEVKLRDRTATVRCLEVHAGGLPVEVNGQPLTLEQGEEKVLQ